MDHHTALVDTTKDNLDLEHAREVLDADHFDLANVKDDSSSTWPSPLRNEISGRSSASPGRPRIARA